jgi:hypothetical protein
LTSKYNSNQKRILEKKWLIVWWTIVGYVEQAEKLNQTLDDPKDGKDVIHVQHDTGESNINDDDSSQLDKLADDITDIADKTDVKVNATGNYSYQADDEANSNKANDGSQLDKSRSNAS